MLEFKLMEIDDIDWYSEIAENANKEQPQIGLDLPFGTNYVWGGYYGTRICRFEGFILKGYFQKDGTVSFAFPFGTGDVKKAIRRIEEYALYNNIPLRFLGLTRGQIDVINSIYPGEFRFNGNRDSYEYIYETEGLASLSGRSLHSKRNHLKHFEEDYNYDFEILDSSNKYEALNVSKEWCEGVNSSDSINYETCAIRKSIENFERLGLRGAIIRVDGKAVAMTIGERISDKAFVIHFEKALEGYRGLYTAINCYFARTLTDYMYINREEDMGICGLRRAKLSYKPAILLERFEGVRNAEIFSAGTR